MKDMEIVPEGKNFRLVTEDELPALADFLVQYMPESLKFHQTIQTYLNNKVWDFHFYVAKNWPEDPICLHFPGCTSTPNGDPYESVTVFCPAARAALVDLLAADDVLLDPARPLYINFTHEAIVARLQRRYEARDAIAGDVYVCDTPPAEDSTDGAQDSESGAAGVAEGAAGAGAAGGADAADAADGADGADAAEADAAGAADGAGVVARLRREHMRAVYAVYPARDIECREVFERLAAALPAYGVFVDGELAAWMVQSYYGAMFSMQTRPEFRRRGFGTSLARRLTAAVAARGYRPFVVIRPENDASRALYTKLGFTRRFRTVRAVLHPR